MNENVRTAVFVCVAVVIALITFAVPAIRLGHDESLEGLEGTLLFPGFKDPLAATSLAVVRYDEATGDRTRFEVAQVDGIWSIPSHEGYPADAKDRLAAAAADLIDLKILGVAGDNSADHGLYGVLDPTNKNLRPGTPGVGMKVAMKGKKDKTLVSMIVGKEDPESPGLRYVRRDSQDVVLTVELSTDELTTDFGDWIEKDLLKLNPWDLREIFVEDYSIDESQGHVLLSDEFTLGYDSSADTKWKLLANRWFNKDGQWEDIKLQPDEQLDTKRLDAMQSALDDLKIVDVARKPAGLSAALAADETSFEDLLPFQNVLSRRGFYVADVGGKKGVHSNEGETRVLMKDGVQYILRFGGIAGSSDDSGKTEDGKQSESDRINRYLFITAEFNPAPIPKPELEPLPTEVPKKDAGGATEQSEPAEPAEKSPEDGAKKTEPTTEAETKAEKEKKADDLEKRRNRIRKENQRKQEEYDGKIAEGRKKVAKLRARFADWYYVISESVYDKIHLGRGEIIKKKEKAADESKDDSSRLPIPPGALPPDAFNELRPRVK